LAPKTQAEIMTEAVDKAMKSETFAKAIAYHAERQKS
jgi:hypothetical protein